MSAPSGVDGIMVPYRTVKAGGRCYAYRRPLTWGGLAAVYRARIEARRSGRTIKGSEAAGLCDPSCSPTGDQWDAGVNTPEKALDALAGRLTGINRDVFAALDVQDLDGTEEAGWDLDVAGAYCSVPDYLAGVPDCMMRKDAGDGARSVHLVSFCCMSAFVTAKQCLSFSEAVAGLVATLCLRGYDVAYTVINAVSSGPVTYAIPITVIERGSDVDSSKVAFASHPAMLRRIMFAYCEQDPHAPLDIRSCGYGTAPYSVPETVARTAIGMGSDERVIILPAVQSVPLNATQADKVKMLLAMVQDQADERAERF